MNQLRVVSVGLATLQDAGRDSFRDVGVARSGAFDTEAYRLACDLIQAPGVPVIELLLGSISVVADQRVTFTVVGEASIDIGSAPFPAGVVSAAEARTTVTVTRIGRGPVYLAILGLTAETVLGSCSYDSLSKLGAPPFAPGTILDLIPTNSQPLGRFLRPEHSTRHQSLELRYVPGPHFDDNALAGQVLQVESVNRSGVRLTGAASPAVVSGTLPSLPVLPGTIQIPAGGQPIVLGPDSGVTGGYPVAGVVVTVDLPRVARLAVGDNVQFQAIDVGTATQLHAEREQWLAHAVLDPDDLTSTG